MIQVGYLKDEGYPVFATDAAGGDGCDLWKTQPDSDIEGWLCNERRVPALVRAGFICESPKKALGIE